MTRKLNKRIWYTKGYKYQLQITYTDRVSITGYTIKTKYIHLQPDGTLTIFAGYAWDGPSGPTIDTHTFMRGSLVHDALYQLLRLQLLPDNYRLNADDELKRICLEDNMCRVRAEYVYKAVRKFASPAADPKHKKKLLIAPKG